jgi:hypothetical protein
MKAVLGAKQSAAKASKSSWRNFMAVCGDQGVQAAATPTRALLLSTCKCGTPGDGFLLLIWLLSRDHAASIRSDSAICVAMHTLA